MERLQLLAATIQDHVSLLHFHIIASAVFPIYTSAHASLSRPSSATTAKRLDKDGDNDDVGEDEGEEDEEVHEMESLSATDAILFPIVAGCVLVFLCYLIQRFGAEIINTILAWYFAGIVITSIGKLLSDGAELALSFLYPAYYSDQGQVWQVKGQSYRTLNNGKVRERVSPLPAVFGRIQLPARLNKSIWSSLDALKQKYALEIYVKTILEVKSRFTLVNLVSAIAGIAVVAYSNFIDKPWWLTNVQGFAVSYFSMQVLSPTTFPNGSLVLGGLFFYDIWAVFFTKYMVFAATKLDQPIKLMFPRPDQEDESALAYSMLGLGDIVLPGLMLGLALRFDLYMFYLRKQVKDADGKAQKSAYTSVKNHWGSFFWTFWTTKSSLPLKLQNARFPKPYFTASLIGYISGMVLTLEVMTYFQHAQPALLYLVPTVLLSIWTTALVRGELKEMLAYSESITGDAEEVDEQKGRSKAEQDKQVSGASDEQSKASESSSRNTSVEKIANKSPEAPVDVSADADLYLHFSVKKYTNRKAKDSIVSNTKAVPPTDS